MRAGGGHFNGNVAACRLPWAYGWLLEIRKVLLVRCVCEGGWGGVSLTRLCVSFFTTAQTYTQWVAQFRHRYDHKAAAVQCAGLVQRVLERARSFLKQGLVPPRQAKVQAGGAPQSTGGAFARRGEERKRTEKQGSFDRLKRVVV